MASIGMTHEQFAELYARQVNTPLATLVRQGMQCAPCPCGANYCLGWKAYWPKTGREEHGNPQKMIEALNRHNERWAAKGWH